MTNLFQHKINFTERFKKRHSLRFHMSLILMATVCSGVLATKILLALHLENVMLRYPLAVIFAYLIFFISVKLWLKYIATSPVTQKANNNSPDSCDILPDMPISCPYDGYTSAGEVFRGGGGGFDGGGATESFDAASNEFADSSSDILSGTIDTSGGIDDAVGDVVGGVAEGLGDEGGVVAVVVFAALAAIMAAVVGAGVYLVYEAPFILSEAAFEFILAASLVRGTKRIDSADWMGSVFKTTSIPFMVTLALATLTGYLIHHYFPEVTRLSELLSRL
ncbi:hypothetical protein FY034_01510 [Trichlorobacter lovleyi]|uniref:hypothetical protein n=1 Tax=Trichlorobacter lovleyi TaxID=313985 RepID=UPI00224046C5|nr:hypothetical protein [Trichlorobacter lovleyi]QOX77669.1 hypothetical protein FY034_01510 [Trichlorobacter lovleyi]